MNVEINSGHELQNRARVCGTTMDPSALANVTITRAVFDLSLALMAGFAIDFLAAHMYSVQM